MQLPFLGEVKFDTINTYYYIVIGVVLIALLILYHFERAYVNFQWRAIRDDNMLAGAVGINVIGYKMVNFTIAAFMAGISGALFASFQHNLSADATSRFAVTTSIYLLVYMVVGGQNSFIGPLLGTAVLTLLAERTRSMQSVSAHAHRGYRHRRHALHAAGPGGSPAQIRIGGVGMRPKGRGAGTGRGHRRVVPDGAVPGRRRAE